MKNKIIVLSLSLLCSMAFKSYSMEKENDALVSMNNLTAKYGRIERAVLAEDLAAVGAFLEEGVTQGEFDEALLLAASSLKPDIACEMIKLLLRAEADIYGEERTNAKGYELYNAMDWALDPMEGGHISIVQTLIDGGFDVNRENSQGVLPIAHGNCVGFLVKAGADINKVNEQGETPLFTCLDLSCRNLWESNNGSCAVKELCRHGADMNAQDKQGRTAIFKAIKEKDLHMVKCLWECGLNTAIADKEGITPLQYAKQMYEDGGDKKGNIDGIIKFLDPKNLKQVQETPKFKKFAADLEQEKKWNAFKAFATFNLSKEQVPAGKTVDEITEKVLHDADKLRSLIVSARAPKLIELCQEIQRSEQEKEHIYAKKTKF